MRYIKNIISVAAVMTVSVAMGGCNERKGKSGATTPAAAPVQANTNGGLSTEGGENSPPATKVLRRRKHTTANPLTEEEQKKPIKRKKGKGNKKDNVDDKTKIPELSEADKAALAAKQAEEEKNKAAAAALAAKQTEEEKNKAAAAALAAKQAEEEKNKAAAAALAAKQTEEEKNKAAAAALVAKQTEEEKNKAAAAALVAKQNEEEKKTAEANGRQGGPQPPPGPPATSPAQPEGDKRNTNPLDTKLPVTPPVTTLVTSPSGTTKKVLNPDAESTNASTLEKKEPTKPVVAGPSAAIGGDQPTNDETKQKPLGALFREGGPKRPKFAPTDVTDPETAAAAKPSRKQAGMENPAVTPPAAVVASTTTTTDAVKSKTDPRPAFDLSGAKKLRKVDQPVEKGGDKLGSVTDNPVSGSKNTSDPTNTGKLPANPTGNMAEQAAARRREMEERRKAKEAAEEKTAENLTEGKKDDGIDPRPQLNPSKPKKTNRADLTFEQMVDEAIIKYSENLSLEAQIKEVEKVVASETPKTDEELAKEAKDKKAAKGKLNGKISKNQGEITAFRLKQAAELSDIKTRYKIIRARLDSMCDKEGGPEPAHLATVCNEAARSKFVSTLFDTVL